MNIPISYLSKHDLNLKVENKPHQGFILVTSKLIFQHKLKALPVCNDSYKYVYVMMQYTVCLFIIMYCHVYTI